MYQQKNQFVIFLLFIIVPLKLFPQSFDMDDGDQSISCGTSYDFTDTGGSFGNYGINESHTLTLSPSDGTQDVQVVFSSWNLGDDILIVYDGEDTSAPVLTTLTSSAISVPFTIVPSSTNTSGALTFSFSSDGDTNAGWAATVSCINTNEWPTNIVNGTYGITCGSTQTFYDYGGPFNNYNDDYSFVISFEPSDASKVIALDFSSYKLSTTGTGDVINIYDGNSTSATLLTTLKGTNTTAFTIVPSNSNSSGALTFEFVPDGNNNTNEGWNVSVRCTDIGEIADNIISGTFTVDCSSSHDFYDNGGPFANYNDSQGFITTFEPADTDQKIAIDFTSYKLSTTGTGDVLNIYDGTSTSATLITSLKGTNTTTFTIVPTKANTSGALTFEFVPNDNTNTNEGWDATIRCTSATEVPDNIVNGTFTIDCAVVSYDFYDNGGPFANYNDSQSFTTTFEPADPTQRIVVDFSSYKLSTTGTGDVLNIYDGTSTAATLITTLKGTNTTAFTITTTNANTSGALTFEFIPNDNSNTNEGWDASIRCTASDEVPNNMTNGTFTIDCSTNYDFYDNGGPFSNYNDSQSFISTFEPKDPAQNIVVDFSSHRLSTTGTGDVLNIYDGTSTSADLIVSLVGTNVTAFTITPTDDNTSGALTFEFIPNDNSNTSDGWDATVRCSNTIEAPTNMANGSFIVPCSGHNFYDYGGPFSNHIDGEDKTITFYPEEEGSYLVFTFSTLRLGTGDILYAYQGNSVDVANLIGAFEGTNSSGLEIISNTAGGAVTFRFVSNTNSNTSDGWAATVTCSATPKVPIYLVNGTYSLNCSGGLTTIYDSGGPFSNYRDNEDITITIQPSVPCSRLTINLTSVRLQSSDIITVTDSGDPTNSLTVSGFTFSLPTPSSLTTTAPNSGLVIRFQSNGSTTWEGFVATLSCTSVNNGDIYWTGAGASSNWNDTDNWSTTSSSGSSCGCLPDCHDVDLDGGGSSNVASIINQDFIINSLELKTSYTNTLSLPSADLLVDNGNIAIETGTLSMSGGSIVNFNNVDDVFSIGASGTLNLSGGQIEVGSLSTRSNADADFQNSGRVTIAGGNLYAADRLVSTNALTLSAGNIYANSFSNGTATVSGQDAASVLVLSGNFTMSDGNVYVQGQNGGNPAISSGGTWDVTGGTFHLESSGSTEMNVGFGGDIHNLTINRTEAEKKVGFSGATNINGDLTITAGEWLLDQNTNLAGNLVNNGTITQTASFTFDGTADQNVGGTGNIELNDWVIEKVTGKVTLGKEIVINSGSTGLTLTDGIIETNSTNYITIEDNATASIGNADSFVDGPILKKGDDDFIFPVGDADKWARLGLTGRTASVDGWFLVEYNLGDSGNDSKTVDSGSDLTHASSIEYWSLDNLNAAGSGQVTLYFEDADASGIAESSTLKVAHWDGSKWEDLGNTAHDLTSGSGYVTSGLAASFSPFTFGNIGSGIAFNILPINLVNWYADYGDKVVHLKWETSNERNSDYYKILKSGNGIDFVELARIESKGDSDQHQSYELLDKDIQRGTCYYRLVHYDLDGGENGYDVLAINVDDESLEWKAEVYPTKINKGDVINWNIKNSDAEMIDISLVQISTGLVILHEKADTKGQLSTKDFPQIISGLYALTFIDGEKQYLVKIFITKGE